MGTRTILTLELLMILVLFSSNKVFGFLGETDRMAKNTPVAPHFSRNEVLLTT